MPLKRWDKGACITFGKAFTAVKVAIPAALLMALIARSSFQAGIDTALDEAAKK